MKRGINNGEQSAARSVEIILRASSWCLWNLLIEVSSTPSRRSRRRVPDEADRPGVRPSQVFQKV